MKINHQIYIWIVLFCCSGTSLWGQFEGPPTADSVVVDSNKIEILFIRQLKSKELPDGAYRELIGDVHLKQQAMHLWCDYGLMKPNKQIDAYGNVQMLQQDSIRIFADTLYYDGRNRQAQLRQNVVLQDTSMTMFTDKLDYDLTTKIATFPEGSLIESDTMTMVSQKGTYNANTSLAHFEDSVRVTGDDYKLIADSLDFNTQTETAFFIGPTTVFHEEKTIYCEDGYYDSKRNYAELMQNAQFENKEEGKEEIARGDKIIFDGAEEMYYLIGNAYYENKDQAVEADTILLDAVTEQYAFRGNPVFKSKDTTQSQAINATYSDYDAATNTMIFRGAVEVTQDNNILTTDSLDYNTSTKDGIARGNVVWRDTVANTKITCAVAIYNDSTEYIKSYGNPVLETQMDGDTMWMRADTLIAMPAYVLDTSMVAYDSSLVDIDTTAQDTLWQDSFFQDSVVVDTMPNRIKKGQNLLGYHNVKIYKSDMQAVCDSFFYDNIDSIFYFYDNPVLWVNKVQFSADTILMQMDSNRLEKVLLYNNSFIVSKNDSLYYNQTKGKNVKASFEDNAITSIVIREEGETVYYAQDDNDAYIGVNDVDCQDMILFFTDNALQRIRFEVNPKAVLHPMGKVNHETLKLEGFQWLEYLQPKSKQDILDYQSTEEETEEKVKVIPLSKK